MNRSGIKEQRGQRAPDTDVGTLDLASAKGGLQEKVFPEIKTRVKPTPLIVLG